MRAVGNVISNGVDYSPAEQTLWIRAELRARPGRKEISGQETFSEEKQGGGTFLQITVTDSGQGFSYAEQKQIFCLSQTADRDFPEKRCGMGRNSSIRRTRAAPEQHITGWDFTLRGRYWKKTAGGWRLGILKKPEAARSGYMFPA